MNIKTFVCFIFSVFLSFSLFAQKEYPTNYFRSPLDIPLFLSGNFGELRNTHFHAGLDLKTQNTEGYNVYAAADGYISRVKIGLWGYGKTIYITHPNGYTTVYAHLQKFAPKLQDYIKRLQYKKKSYEVETYFRPSDFPIKKGNIIAVSGNTGGSGGPHLHFEIRDTKTQNPLNPLLFGYQITDKIPPSVFRLLAYPLGKNAQINGSQLPVEVNFTKQPDGTYLADEIQATGEIGFGIQAIDKQDYTYHQNGVYSVKLSVNGSPYTEYTFDELSFSETPYIATLIDYELWKTNKSRVQLTYKNKGNQLSTIYKKSKNNGIINIREDMDYRVRIEVKDFENNITDIHIPIEGKKLPIKFPRIKEKGKAIIANRDHYFTFEQGNVYFPKNTFFENMIIQIKRENDTIFIHNSTVPLKRNYNLSIHLPKNMDTTMISKTFIAYIDDYGNPKYLKTIRKEEYVSTRTKDLGKFVLMQDTIAPKAVPINFMEGSILKNPQELTVKITDDLSGIKSYTPKLNGKWILMEYEPKKDLLTFDVNDLKEKLQDHIFELEVEDNIGNKSDLKIHFQIIP